MKKERKIFKFYTWKLLRKFKVQNDSNDHVSLVNFNFNFNIPLSYIDFDFLKKTT